MVCVPQGRDQGGNADCERDADDTSPPSEPIEDLPEDRRTDQTAGKVTGEIDTARGAAVGGGGPADEAGRCRLGEEGPHADEDHPQQNCREIR